MQVSCPQCQTKLQLSADKLPDHPFAIKCPKCETTFQVTPPAPTETVATAVSSVSAPPEPAPPTPPPTPPPAQTAPAPSTPAPVPPAPQPPELLAPQPAPPPSALPPTPAPPPASPSTPAPATVAPKAPAQREADLLSGKETIPNMAVGWTHSMPTPTTSDNANSLVGTSANNGDLLQTLAALLSGNATQSQTTVNQIRKRNVVACLSSQEDLINLHNALTEDSYELMAASSVDEVTGMLQSGNQLDILLLDPNFEPEHQGSASIMRYVNMLNPARRRRIYVTVVSHSFRTLDTQTAFSHGVNLIVNSADISNLPMILSKSILDFNNLYRAYNVASSVAPF